jgi:NTP pyrophosphatase (non-canonical NTP hydrolase)
MNLDDYQRAAAETAIYPARKTLQGLVYCTLGLAGEAGELANKVKKILRDSKGVVDLGTVAMLASEAGDVLWYLAELAANLDVKLSEVAEANIDKLAARQRFGTLKGSGDER